MKTQSAGRFRAALAAAATILLLGTTPARAEEVVYTAPGIISVTNVPMIYNDKYAIQKTDFGFAWLDTLTLQAGLVQVEAHCGLGQPNPETGI